MTLRRLFSRGSSRSKGDDPFSVSAGDTVNYGNRPKDPWCQEAAWRYKEKQDRFARSRNALDEHDMMEAMKKWQERCYGEGYTLQVSKGGNRRRRSKSKSRRRKITRRRRTSRKRRASSKRH